MVRLLAALGPGALVGGDRLAGRDGVGQQVLRQRLLDRARVAGEREGGVYAEPAEHLEAVSLRDFVELALAEDSSIFLPQSGQET